MKIEDVSAEVFGKYQFCTTAKDGLQYSDNDFIYPDGVRQLKPGALPSPWQSTPALMVKAREMHEAAAKDAADKALRTTRDSSGARQSLWRRMLALFR